MRVKNAGKTLVSKSDLKVDKECVGHFGTYIDTWQYLAISKTGNIPHFFRFLSPSESDFLIFGLEE